MTEHLKKLRLPPSSNPTDNDMVAKIATPPIRSDSDEETVKRQLGIILPIIYRIVDKLPKDLFLAVKWETIPDLTTFQEWGRYMIHVQIPTASKP